MKALNPHYKHMKRWVLTMLGCTICFIHAAKTNVAEAAEGLGGPPHIGTFEGSTTFTTSSSNGINPGLYLEVMDSEGNYTEYTSEDGVITVPNTREGAYVTQAKLLGKTKYKDQQTGELLDNWEDGRDLKLESVESPGLTTTGKNLFDMAKTDSGYLTMDDPYTLYTPDYNNKTSGYIKVKPNTTYVYSINGFELDEVGGFYWTGWYYYSDINIVSSINSQRQVNMGNKEKNKTVEFTTPSDCHYIRIGSRGLALKGATAQLEEGAQATAYKPYQSSLLSVYKDTTLKGIDAVRDTLDLVTGRMTERIGEFMVNHLIDIRYSGVDSDNYAMFTVFGDVSNIHSINRQILGCDRLIVRDIYGSHRDFEGIELGSINPRNIYIKIAKNELDRWNDTLAGLDKVNKFKKWLQANPITIQYELEKATTKTISLNSSYYFKPVLNREITVNGTVLPLVLSVTIPTEPLSFTLDPNQEEGQQFVAPDFSITNHTPASISLELKAFEQTTQVFNDVLPTAHENWNRLDKFQSKDIALALVPKPSKGWVSLDKGPRYVADDSNYELGRVEAGSTVGFTFHALHGRAFGEALNPQYRLAFEFGF